MGGEGRLVRVAWEGERHPPRPAVVSGCPVCGGSHQVPDPLWRELRAVDAGREAEVSVSGEGRRVGHDVMRR
ncbi:MAG TPA: hypothetical protein VFX44_08495 [Solirubrobacterales bacterium]|nr:hypothetical protein [Solirubrobacterales bacterium]